MSHVFGMFGHCLVMGITAWFFLAEWAMTPTSKASDEKIITTASGLQYVDLVVGTGATPQKGDRITMDYTGRLENGQKFDSSLDRGKPFVFYQEVTPLIPGWTEGVATMKVGGKRKLIIPPKLGYGEDGADGVIPPNATLIFELDLISVEKGN